MAAHDVLELVAQALEVAEREALDVNGSMDDAVLHLRLAARTLEAVPGLPSASVQPDVLPSGQDRLYRDLDRGSRALAAVEVAIAPLSIRVTGDDLARSAALDVDTGLVVDHLSRARQTFEDWISRVTDLGGGHFLDDGLDDRTPSLGVTGR